MNNSNQLREEIIRRVNDRFSGGREEFISDLKRASMKVPKEDVSNLSLVIIYYNKIFFDSVPIIEDVKANYELANELLEMLDRNAVKVNCDALAFAGDLQALKILTASGKEPMRKAG